MKTRRMLAAAGLAALSVSAVLAAGVPGPSKPRPAPGEPTLDEVRQATERFRDVKVALAEGYTERVRLTRRFNGVNSTVMVPTDYPVQPGDTIYVLERFF